MIQSLKPSAGSAPCARYSGRSRRCGAAVGQTREVGHFLGQPLEHGLDDLEPQPVRAEQLCALGLGVAQRLTGQLLINPAAPGQPTPSPLLRDTMGVSDLACPFANRIPAAHRRATWFTQPVGRALCWCSCFVAEEALRSLTDDVIETLPVPSLLLGMAWPVQTFRGPNREMRVSGPATYDRIASQPLLATSTGTLVTTTCKMACWTGLLPTST
jgi:hypothetical protein